MNDYDVILNLNTRMKNQGLKCKYRASQKIYNFWNSSFDTSSFRKFVTNALFLF